MIKCTLAVRVPNRIRRAIYVLQIQDVKELDELREFCKLHGFAVTQTPSNYDYNHIRTMVSRFSDDFNLLKIERQCLRGKSSELFFVNGKSISSNQIHTHIDGRVLPRAIKLGAAEKKKHLAVCYKLEHSTDEDIIDFTSYLRSYSICENEYGICYVNAIIEEWQKFLSKVDKDTFSNPGIVSMIRYCTDKIMSVSNVTDSSLIEKSNWR